MISPLAIVTIIVISTLLFGSVETWAIAITGIITIAFFDIWFIRRFREAFRLQAPWEKWIAISIVAFFSLSILQLIPLPSYILKAVSPGEYSIINRLSLSSVSAISLYRHATMLEAVKFSLYLMVFLMASFGIEGRRDLKRIINSLIVFGFLLSIFAIIQKATWNGKIYWFRELSSGGSAFGPFVNRNHFAGLIGMLIPLALGVSLESRIRGKQAFFGFLCVVMGIALFYSLSRGGIISFFASISVFSGILLYNRTSKKSVFFIAVFLSVLFAYLIYLGISPVIERFAQAEKDTSMAQRIIAWQGTIKAIGDFWLFGSGLGTFQYVFPVYYPSGLQLFYDHAHNDYLEFFLETGLIGAVIMASFFFSLIMGIIKSNWNKGGIYIRAGLIASITSILIHSLVDFNLHIPSNAITFSAVLGLLVAGLRMDAEGDKEPFMLKYGWDDE